MRPESRIAAIVHQGARELHAAGAIDAVRMAEFDALCLVPVPHYKSGRELRKLRRRLKLKPERLAALLNTSPRTLHRWESGRTRPRGAALRLLQVLDSKGVEALEPPGQGITRAHTPG